jgi:hypothetical protein
MTTALISLLVLAALAALGGLIFVALVLSVKRQARRRDKGDQRRIMQETTMAAVNRKIDDIVIEQLDTVTNDCAFDRPARRRQGEM